MTTKKAGEASALQKLQSKAFPVAARVYTDLVKRRTQVKVVESSQNVDDMADVAFVVGCFRSGTTLLRFILDSHTGLASPGETEFLAPMSSLLTDRRQAEALEFMGFEREFVAKWIRRSSGALYNDYATAKEVSMVIDKTPGYTDFAPVLFEVFPDSKYMGLYRHPLDQIASFTRGLSYAPPEISNIPEGAETAELAVAAAEYWSDSFEKMEQLADLAGDAWLRVKYEDLCADTQSETIRLCDHLGVDFEEPMINYWEHSHDVGLEGGKALGFRKIEARSGAWESWDPAVVSKILDATERGRSVLGYE